MKENLKEVLNMNRIKKVLTKERLNKIVENGKKGLDIAVPIIGGLLLFSRTMTNELDSVRYNYGNMKYDDAVKAIMKSSMWSNDKSKAVALLKTDCDPSFYKAIVNIANSSMWSNDKLKTIQNMCKNEKVSDEEA